MSCLEAHADFFRLLMKGIFPTKRKKNMMNCTLPCLRYSWDIYLSGQGCGVSIHIPEPSIYGNDITVFTIHPSQMLF